MQAYVIDIESLCDRDSYLLPKEITIISLQNSFIAHWLIRSPHNISDIPRGILNDNRKLTRERHGLEWTDGESSLDKVEYYLHRLATTAKRVYVEGKPNVNYLEKIMSCEIVDSTELAPLISTMPITCTSCILHGIQRRKGYFCSYNRVERLKTWIKSNENMYVEIEPLYESYI